MNNSQWFRGVVAFEVISTVALIYGAISFAQSVQAQEIQRIKDLDRPATTLREWLSQTPPPPQAPIQVTGVRLNPTDAGLEIILQTASSTELQAVRRTEDKTLTIDIPNAVLALPNQQPFQADTATATVTATQLAGNRIQVQVVGKTALPTATVVAEPPPVAQPPAEDEEEITVTGDRPSPYRAPNSNTATKTDTPLRDIPQSIQAVPRQVIEDQQATRLTDALRNVSGISQGNASSRNVFESVLSRGFSTTNVLRNGLQANVYTAFGFNSSAIERLEVLKGPASVLYGQGNLGGTINYVTKQPLREPYYSVEGSAGSFDFYRGAIDLSGPINIDRTVLYRLNASAQTTRSFIDFFEEQRYFVTPVITWQISDRTKLTLEAEYFDVSQQFDYGLPAVGTLFPNPNGKIPRNRSVGEPSNSLPYRAFQIAYDLEHRFSENWQIRSAFSANLREYTANVVSSTALLNNNRTLNRQFSDLTISPNLYNLDNYIAGKFSTGSIQHQLVVGFNLSRQDIPFYKRVDGIAVPIDVFNPVYNPTRVRVTNRSDAKFRSDALGIYLQDQITLLPNLKLLLGGRLDIASQKRDDLIRSITESQQQEAFSPRVGIVYQPVPPISLYASYGRSFQPVGSIFVNTLPEPEEGTQYEAGIKADLSNRLSATLAFYNLTRTNVTTADPNNPLLSIQVGEQRSRGIEFDLSGEILPGWNIIAGYALTEAEVTKDNTFRVGNLLNNVPRHSFSLWTTYTIPRGPLQGFGVGGGIFYVGDRQGDLANTFELPSYLRTDAAIFYRRDRFRAALNFKNLFNIDYFESATNRTRVFYGDPFTVQGTISLQF